MSICPMAMTIPTYDIRFCFMLHGFSENENAWVTKGHINQAADHLIAAGEIPPIVIIMPGSGDNWYVDLKEKIETAFVQDLVPEVDRSFRLIPEREGRGIGGDSMGGYGALRFILKYPEQFGVARPDEPGHLRPRTALNEQRP